MVVQRLLSASVYALALLASSQSAAAAPVAVARPALVEPTQVPCTPWGGHIVTLDAEVELTGAQARQLTDMACAGVYGALTQARLEQADEAKLQQMRFVVVDKVRGSPLNALYDSDTGRVLITAGMLRSDIYPLPAATFIVGHELGHGVRSTVAKSVTVRILAGALFSAFGLQALLHLRRRRWAAFVGMGAVSLAGAALAIAPHWVYDGELVADRYGYQVMHAVFQRQLPGSDAAQSALGVANRVFASQYQAEDEPAVMSKDVDGHVSLLNINPHPSTRTRIESLAKFARE